ncbi:MAG TPA: alpha/beta hydrolase [Gaiellaceae bacterium]|nr:alpha/beta hydrolase [Gaiellaceae bacterium]
MSTLQAPSITIGAEATASGPQRLLFVERQARLLGHFGVDAASRFLTLAQPPMRVHVLEAGQGHPVLILHGGDGQAVDWSPLMAELQSSSHVVSVDRPGFGLSDPFDYRRVDLRSHAADFVTGVLDALGLEQAILIGGSMGGFFALAAAAERPERVRGLALVGMPAGISRDASLPLRLMCGLPGASSLFMRRLEKGGAKARRKQFQGMFGTDPATIPDVYFELQEAGLRIPGAAATWSVLVRRLASLGGFRDETLLVDDLPRIETPTLIVWGEKDMAPIAAGRAAAALLPNASFVVLEGTGHFPFLQQPKACADLIRDALLTGEGSVR